MPEAEDVITDAARYTTVFVRDLWQRHRHVPENRLLLADVAERLSLLIHAVCGRSMSIKTVTPPPPPTLLQRTFQRHLFPISGIAVPATDDASIWLPDDPQVATRADAIERFRCMALHQAVRAIRGSAKTLESIDDPLARAVFELLEAHSAEAELVRMLPGLRDSLRALRLDSLRRRPRVAQFPPSRHALETFARAVMSDGAGPWHSTAACRDDAIETATRLRARSAALDQPIDAVLYRDQWLGELKPAPSSAASVADTSPSEQPTAGPIRSARLRRRPQVRDATRDEDEDKPGAWMVQTAQPHEHAEDPFGVQRPIDRDEQIPADEFADLVSDLNTARLISTPQAATEVLVSEGTLPRARGEIRNPSAIGSCGIAYPEWDYRSQHYREPGAIVRLLDCDLGDECWVTHTLERHRGLLREITRQFDLLRGQRTRLCKQLDGDAIDVDAYVEAYGDFRAGHSLSQAVYECIRPLRRELAITLLIDVSGSTDAWIVNQQRVIDVEREALLLVCHALDSLHAPYNVLGFSGTGATQVTVRNIKGMREPHTLETSLRIAGLEADRYTRVGAAIRHATATLMREPAMNRLLLLLSDGKPNDHDEYEGRYGIEDTRQAVNEAKLQGIRPFCLTIDRQAASYLPYVFGIGQYALLTQPERLPVVLLRWMKKLLST